MVWSGVTKLVKGLSMENQRPIEVGGLGIFGPEMSKFQKLRDPLNKGIEQKKSNPFDLLKPTRFLACEDFFIQSGYSIEPDTNSANRVGLYSKSNRGQVNEWF